MLAIIAHHYVVNSTVAEHFDYTKPTIQQDFLLIWGMWGKVAINSFVLISGYFLCAMNLSLRRYLKLVVQILFYGIVIMVVFALTGYQPLTVGMTAKQIFGLLIYINSGFTASFMAFYAFVPFYNKLLNILSKRETQYLIGGLLLIFTIAGTLFKASTMNEPFWYMTLYFVAAYIRKYPSRFTESLGLNALVLVVAILASVASVFVISRLVARMGFEGNRAVAMCYYFVNDSNKLLAFVVGTTAFLTFKNLPPFHNRVINFLGAGTFAVLLIHASSDTMRHWLWVDTCNVPGMLYASMPDLLLQALTIPLAIFIACSSVDWLRRRFIERPLFNGRQ